MRFYWILLFALSVFGSFRSTVLTDTNFYELTKIGSMDQCKSVYVLFHTPRDKWSRGIYQSWADLYKHLNDRVMIAEVDVDQYPMLGRAFQLRRHTTILLFHVDQVIYVYVDPETVERLTEYALGTVPRDRHFFQFSPDEEGDYDLAKIPPPIF